MSTAQDCTDYWPVPDSLFWKEGINYVGDHFILELVTHLNEEEGTLLNHLLICQEKGDADALKDLTYRKIKCHRQPVEDESHFFSSLISRVRQPA
jgi:hypothetical protein